MNRNSDPRASISPETTFRILLSVFVSIVVLTLAALVAVSMIFLQDDAFISFRYAENLVNGYGLAWEPGHYVQGYTNFLWVLMLAASSLIGFELENAVIGLGLAHYAMAIGLFGLISIQLFKNLAVALAAVLVLAANASFAAYATGGLETMQQAAFFLAALLLYLKLINKPDNALTAVSFSLICGVLMLIRLDSSIFVMCLGLAALMRVSRDQNRRLVLAAALIMPGAIILTVYLGWALLYYGSILPNTFYVKADGLAIERLVRGAKYIASFFTFYALGLPLVVGAVFSVWKGPKYIYVPLTAFSVLWLAYISWVGGDFMEFRLFVPALPIMVLLMAAGYTAANWDKKAVMGVVAVAFLAITSVAYQKSDWRVDGVERLEELTEHLYDPAQDWVTIGRRLGEVFPEGYDEGPIIAVTAAGAIPFYSKLRAVDMFGLNDAEIARTGIPIDQRPGHSIIADAQSLVDKNVSLIVGHPVMLGANESFEGCFNSFNVHSRSQIPQAILEAELLELPVNNNYRVALLYVGSHPSVERAIGQGEIRRVGFHNLSC